MYRHTLPVIISCYNNNRPEAKIQDIFNAVQRIMTTIVPLGENQSTWTCCHAEVPYGSSDSTSTCKHIQSSDKKPGMIDYICRSMHMFIVQTCLYIYETTTSFYSTYHQSMYVDVLHMSSYWQAYKVHLNGNLVYPVEIIIHFSHVIILLLIQGSSHISFIQCSNVFLMSSYYCSFKVHPISRSSSAQMIDYKPFNAYIIVFHIYIYRWWPHTHTINQCM